jgi:hypothetical protein
MTALLLTLGIACLLIGAAFFWLNLNSPIQTRIPAFTLPVGAVALLLWLGRILP